ncbi:hypothetical protein BJ508DRAFT_314243 [Ascobolus immersus RN42]|uniref:Uncharacterized protein n=1 Tax=Ascobolus immersus RN42 TaxID=1160509 RepID=A0A3N4HHN9_ASCIM|nr:hypothetical protein BJ508DRAFT_314243 [Ascobolus immersus RN42]
MIYGLPVDLILSIADQVDDYRTLQNFRHSSRKVFNGIPHSYLKRKFQIAPVATRAAYSFMIAKLGLHHGSVSTFLNLMFDTPSMSTLRLHYEGSTLDPHWFFTAYEDFALSVPDLRFPLQGDIENDYEDFGFCWIMNILDVMKKLNRHTADQWWQGNKAMFIALQTSRATTDRLEERIGALLEKLRYPMFSYYLPYWQTIGGVPWIDSEQLETCLLFHLSYTWSIGWKDQSLARVASCCYNMIVDLALIRLEGVMDDFTSNVLVHESPTNALLSMEMLYFKFATRASICQVDSIRQIYVSILAYGQYTADLLSNAQANSLLMQDFDLAVADATTLRKHLIRTCLRKVLTSSALKFVSVASAGQGGRPRNSESESEFSTSDIIIRRKRTAEKNAARKPAHEGAKAAREKPLRQQVTKAPQPPQPSTRPPSLQEQRKPFKTNCVPLEFRIEYNPTSQETIVLSPMGFEQEPICAKVWQILKEDDFFTQPLTHTCISQGPIVFTGIDRDIL